jgi:hypothetical protein
MSPAARKHLPHAFVLALVMLCPAAAAESGEVTAEGASYRGGAEQAGDLVAFYLSDIAVAASQGAPPSPANSFLSIDIRAARLEALEVERQYLIGPAVGEVSQPVDDPRYDRNAPPERTVLDDARATLASQQEAFQVHMVPAEGGSALFTARNEAGAFSQMASLFMDAGRFREAGPLDADERVTDAPEFWAVRVDEPLVVHDDQASHFVARVTGDVVLEIMGGVFEAKDRDESVVLESGVWTAPAADVGVPLGVDAQRQVLLRMFLHDATIDLSFQGDETDAFWASQTVASEHDGPADLEGATGEIATADGVVLLDHERFVVPPGNVLTMQPSEPGLALAVQPAATPASSAGGATAGPQTPALVAVVAVLALLAAAGLGLLHRANATPDLRQVELAIEGERYGRAARLAKRILRARPGYEDAVLGRAIALSRAGRAGAAISEIHQQLATRGASDGSLHYVLGLSFLDVGRVDEARVALAEAVRLTPALEADVAVRLGQPVSDSSPATLREVHGYA